MPSSLEQYTPRHVDTELQSIRVEKSSPHSAIEPSPASPLSAADLLQPVNGERSEARASDESSDHRHEAKYEAAATLKALSDDGTPVLPGGPPPLERQPTEQTNVNLSQREILIIYGCLMSCVLLTGLDASVIGTSGPVISRDFGDYNLIAWLVSAYLLTSAACMPCYGKMSDIFGRMPCFQFAIWVFALGSLLAAVSRSMVMLIISRAIQGVGGAGISTLSQTVIGDMLAPADRGRYQGLTSSVTALSSVAGPLVGGLFSEYWTWRGIFYLNLPFCAFASLIMFKYMRITVKHRRVNSWHDIDWVGSLVVISATTALVMPLVWGGTTYAWSSPIIIALLVGAAVLIVVFLSVEHRFGVKAIVPLHMFASRNFCLCLVIRFFGGAVLFSLITLLPNYFQTVWDNSALISGLRVTPTLFTGILGSVMCGQSIARLGVSWKIFPVAGTALQLLGIGLLARTGVDTNYGELVVFMMLAGIGYGWTGPAATLVVQSSVAIADLASASAAGTFVSQLGGAIGTAVATSILNNLYLDRLTSIYASQQLGTLSDNPINLSGDDIAALPAAQRQAYQDSYVYGLDRMYYCVVGFAGAQFIAACLLKNVPLRGKRIKQAETTKQPPLPLPLQQAQGQQQQPVVGDGDGAGEAIATSADGVVAPVLGEGGGGEQHCRPKVTQPPEAANKEQTLKQ